MPILSKPVSPLKNVNNVLQIDKNLLVAHSAVAASAYFSDMANWKQIFVFYRSTSGRQDQLVAFDATQGTPEANFLVSTKGRDVFQVQKVIIRDFDNGELTIPRSGLVASEFDIDMTPPSAMYTRNFASPSSLLASETDSSSTVSTNKLIMSYSSTYINKNADIVYSLGQSYTFRFYVDSFVGGEDLTIYSSGSHFVSQVPHASITAAIGSSFDVTFTANATDVGSLTKMFLISGPNVNALRFTKIEFIQNI